jgi:hypothetical protein
VTFEWQSLSLSLSLLTAPFLLFHACLICVKEKSFREEECDSSDWPLPRLVALPAILKGRKICSTSPSGSGGGGGGGSGGSDGYGDYQVPDRHCRRR